MRIARLSAALGLAGLLASSVVAPVLAADSVADFYKGKKITLLIGYSTGGGYDTYARTVARHMGRHIPGKPDIIPRNKPGAGSILVANELYNKSRKDGTVIGVFGRGVPMEPLFGNRKAAFDPAKYTWLGSANNEVSVCISWHTTGINTVNDLLTKDIIVGGTGPSADTDVFPRILNNLLDAKLKIVTGYPGGNDINLALERGEVQARCGYSWSSAKSRSAKWLAEKKIKVLMQMSTAKHPDLPDVPFIMDLATNDRDKKILEIIFARQAWGRPFVAPPGVPADRAKALQDAFMATMTDPKFLADTKKQKLEISPIDGATIGKLIASVATAPKELIEAAKDASINTKKTKTSKAVIPIETKKGELTKTANGGRSISFKIGSKTKKVAVSGSGTKVTLGGKKENRKNLKPGMACTVTYQGGNAKEIACN